MKNQANLPGFVMLMQVIFINDEFSAVFTMKYFNC